MTFDEIVDPHAQVPLPTSEIQFIGEALGTFIAWHKALMMPYLGPQKVSWHHILSSSILQFKNFLILYLSKILILVHPSLKAACQTSTPYT